MSKPSSKFLMLSLLGLLPSLPLVFFGFTSSNIQYLDYWEIVESIMISGFSFSSLLVWQNEHFVGLPVLIYRANIWLTNGTQHGLLYWVMLVMILQAILIAKLLIDQFEKKQPHPNKFLTMALALLIGVFVFHPASLHYWIKSMSGTAWLTANVFSLYAIFFAARGFEQEGLKGLCTFGLAAGAGILATLTYGSSLAVWPVLVCIFLCSRQHMLVRGWLFVFGAGLLCVYGILYHRPAKHDALEFIPLVYVKYALQFFASPLNVDLTQSIYIGAIVALFVVYCGVNFCVRLYQQNISVERMWWLGVLLYGAQIVVLISLSRAEYGAKNPFASRYFSIAALVWIGIVFEAAYRMPRLFRGWTIILILCWYCYLYTSHGYIIENNLSADTRRRAGEQMILAQTPLKGGLISEALTRNVQAFERQSASLHKIGHYPFGAISDECPSWGTGLDYQNYLKQAPQIEVTHARKKSKRLKLYRFKAPAEPQSGCFVLINDRGRAAGFGTTHVIDDFKAKFLTHRSAEVEYYNYVFQRKKAEIVAACYASKKQLIYCLPIKTTPS
ncbi:hypothetical protein JNK13_03400 [bacterium]|nr:hypothetical protein [bacterium]